MSVLLYDTYERSFRPVLQARSYGNCRLLLAFGSTCGIAYVRYAERREGTDQT